MNIFQERLRLGDAECNTEVILEDRWIANLRRLLSSRQSFFPSSSAQPPENRTSINTPRQKGTKKYLAETMLTPEVVGELLLIVEILWTVDRADKRLISV